MERRRKLKFSKPRFSRFWRVFCLFVCLFVCLQYEKQSCAYRRDANRRVSRETPGRPAPPVPPYPRSPLPPKKKKKKNGVGRCYYCFLDCIDTLPIVPVGLVLNFCCPWPCCCSTSSCCSVFPPC
jgi:hypothetical protein